MDERNNSGNLNSGHWNSGDQNSGHRNSGDQNSGHLNSGNRNSGNQNSGNRNSGNRNSGNQNSGDRNSGNLNSGDQNSGHLNSGHLNSGHWNSGNRNSGHWNSGHFNSNDGVFTLFNKPTTRIDLPYINVNVTEWVSENNMTDEEKKANPKFFVTQGYLKTIPYKEAWAKYWAGASKEEKDVILNLPNFDAVVFHEITGIDVAVNLDKEKQVMIKEAEDLMKRGMDLLNKAKGICA